MPVVLRIGPYSFLFYSLENDEPPHIHVRRDQKIAKFWLDPVALASQGGYPLHEVTKIRHMVENNHRLFLEAWHAYFNSTSN